MSEANQPDGQGTSPGATRAGTSRTGSFLVLTLLALVAVQSARLIWVLVSPAGPLGPAQTASSQSVDLTSGFDPFFRLQAPTGSNIVTSLPLKLFGTRRDTATGQGSAIIATPDGMQSSFAVGEVILPGVILASVGSDEVSIDRGGSREKLFLDQSVPAPIAQPNVPAQSQPAPIVPALPPVEQPTPAAQTAPQTMEPQ